MWHVLHGGNISVNEVREGVEDSDDNAIMEVSIKEVMNEKEKEKVRRASLVWSNWSKRTRWKLTQVQHQNQVGC